MEPAAAAERSPPPHQGTHSRSTALIIHYAAIAPSFIIRGPWWLHDVSQNPLLHVVPQLRGPQLQLRPFLHLASYQRDKHRVEPASLATGRPPPFFNCHTLLQIVSCKGQVSRGSSRQIRGIHNVISSAWELLSTSGRGSLLCVSHKQAVS